MLAAALMGCARSGSFKQVSVKTIQGQENSFHYLLSEYQEGSHAKYALILVLHGAGENAKTVYSRWIDEAGQNSVMVLAPDWMAGFESKKNKDAKEFYIFLEEVFKRYPSIDKEKLFIAGASLGGLFAQQLLIENPSCWKAGVLIAFSPPRWPEKKDFPPMLFVFGEKDPAYRSAQNSIQQLRQSGTKVSLMVDPKAQHEHRAEWNKQIFEWILEQG